MGSTPPLRFRKDGSFTIMQIADTQEIPAVSKDTLKLLNAALDQAKPDLVVFTGDQIKGYGVTFRGGNRAEKVRRTLDLLLEPLVKRNIPFAVTFGNHDEQVGLSNQEQLAFYRKYPQCLGGDPPELPGAGTFALPILGSRDEKVKFNLYLIDSHGDAKGGGYDPVDPAQIAWYRRVRDQLAQENGGQPVPSLVFQHIPVPEYYQVLKQVEKKAPGAIRAYRTHKNEYYVLDPEKVRKGGFLGEPPAIPDQNTGEFDALKEKGDVLGIYVGHDHKNSFVGRYQGIDLGYCPGSGFNVYGPSVDRAVRVFTLHEETPREYQTHTISYRQLFGTQVANPIMEYCFVHSPTTVDAAIPMVLKGAAALAGVGVVIALLRALL